MELGRTSSRPAARGPRCCFFAQSSKIEKSKKFDRVTEEERSLDNSVSLRL